MLCMVVECPNCENEYERLGHHWSMSSDCGEPELTDRQHEVLTGLLLGDANVSESDNRKPHFQIMMKSGEFVEWISDELGVFATKISEVEGTGYGEGNIYYQMRTRRADVFSQYNDWYGDNGKIFPDDIELTPLILKVWYCCDGDMSVDDRWNTKHYARISSKNEADNKRKVNSYFTDLDFQPNWNDGCRFTFGREGSHEFWQYIGEPLPGFEYKWPDRYK